MKKPMTTELMPTNGRKSFYGKAKVISADGDLYLRSYDTIVAGMVDGYLRRFTDKRSNTTSSHIKAFLDMVDPDTSVSAFYDLPRSKSKASIY